MVMFPKQMLRMNMHYQCWSRVGQRRINNLSKKSSLRIRILGGYFIPKNTSHIVETYTVPHFGFDSSIGNAVYCFWFILPSVGWKWFLSKNALKRNGDVKKMNHSQTVHIAVISDEGYAYPTTVMLASAKHNKKKESKYCIHCISNGMTSFSKNHLLPML